MAFHHVSQVENCIFYHHNLIRAIYNCYQIIQKRETFMITKYSTNDARSFLNAGFMEQQFKGNAYLDKF